MCVAACRATVETVVTCCLKKGEWAEKSGGGNNDKAKIDL